MTEDEHNKPPKTVAEIGIHIGYIREDLLEIKESLKGTPSRNEFVALEKRVTLLESVVDGVRGAIVKWAVAIFVGMVLAFYGLNKFL